MNNSRRQILKTAGLLGVGTLSAGFVVPPARKFASLLIQEAIRDASASAGVGRYVAFALTGAPARWMFDHVMKTKDGEIATYNSMLANRYVSTMGAATSSEYATHKVGDVHMPPVWASQVARASGGTRPMSELLQNMIIMRGYGTGVDGHPNNMVKQLGPLPGAGSLTGHVADQSSNLVKAFRYPAHIADFTGFASPKGGGIASIFQQGANANILNSLLSAFVKRPELQTLEATRSRHESLIGSVSSAFKSIGQSRNPASATLAVDQDAALKILKVGLEDLDAAWVPLFAKYKTLLESTYRDRSVSGLSDLPIPAGAERRFQESNYAVDSGTVYYPKQGFDIRDLTVSANLDSMAQAFALAEFALTRGYSSSMELGGIEPQNLTGVYTSSNLEVFDPAGRAISSGFSFDHHFMGAMTGIHLSGCFYRAFSAGLLELVDQLKAVNVFKDTVIQILTDFGRAPRESGGGSDHGFDAMITSVLTGKRQGVGPLVLGNILKNGTGGAFPANYSGTLGYKAPTTLWGDTEVLSPMHVASTIGGLLNLEENVWLNSARPLAIYDGANVVAKASGDIV